MRPDGKWDNKEWSSIKADLGQLTGALQIQGTGHRILADTIYGKGLGATAVEDALTAVLEAYLGE